MFYLLELFTIYVLVTDCSQNISFQVSCLHNLFSTSNLRKYLYYCQFLSMICICVQSPMYLSIQDILLFMLSSCKCSHPIYMFRSVIWVIMQEFNQKPLVTIFHSIQFKVTCAFLVAAGENLDNFGDVKNILFEIGIYYQIQVMLLFLYVKWCETPYWNNFN